MLRYLLLLAGLLSAACSRAQFNDSVHYYAGVNLSGNINTTDKAQNMVFNNGIRLGIHRKRFELNNSNTWIYGQQQGQLTNNDFNSAVDFNRFFAFPHFNYWGLANYNTSYSLKINDQYQLGIGLAYSFIDRKNFKLKVSDGIVLESSDITISDTSREQYSTFRNSLRVTTKGTIAELLSFSGSVFWQPSLNNGTDYIVRSTLSASLKLKKWLSLTTAFTYNRFNRTQKENALFVYGITIENFF